MWKEKPLERMICSAILAVLPAILGGTMIHVAGLLMENPNLSFGFSFLACWVAVFLDIDSRLRFEE